MGDSLEDYFDDDIPWLCEEDLFFRGVEVGALLMLCRMGIPQIQAKIRWDNEDQIRVAAPRLGYIVDVMKREEDWSYLTLEHKQIKAAMESE